VASAPSKKNTISISKDNFYNNKANDTEDQTADGGAIYVENGNVTINKSNFGSVNTPEADGNSATRGGAIFNKQDTTHTADADYQKYNVTNVKSSTFVENSASQGGAVYNEGTMKLSKNTFGTTDKLQNVYKNTAEQGGAVYNSGMLTDTSSSFNYNTAAQGGAIYNEGTILTANSKGSITGGLKSTKLNNNAAEVGGAVYNSGIFAAVKSTFTANTATEAGGAVYNGEYIVSESGTVLSGEATLNNSTFVQNTALQGGAVYNDGHLLVNGSTFGKAPNTKQGIAYANTAEQGGAVYNNYAARVTSSKFNYNTATTDGGAIYTAAGADAYDHAATVIDKSTFTNNSAGNYGGALYVGTYSIVQVADSSFTNNHAGVHGGAIYADKDSEVDILALKKNVTFKNNTIGINNDLEAIYLDTATLKLFADKKRTISINDNIYGKDSTIYTSGTGKIYISNEAELRQEGSGITFINGGVLALGDEVTLANTKLALQGGSTTSIANNKIGTLSLKTLAIDNNTTANIVLDASLKTGETDKVEAQTTEGTGNLNVSGINLISNSKTPVTLNIGENSLVDTVSATKAETAEATYRIKTSLDNNGNLMAVAYGQRAKASVLAAPVAAQLGGYFTQINSYDQAFMNMDTNMTKTLEERNAEANCKFACSDPNLMAMGSSSAYDNGISTNGKGLWTRPYVTFERVNLSNGPRVGNIAYGNFFGGDADLKPMRNGWKRQFSAYIGYNGSTQDFDRQSVDQNGGTIGITEVWYKNNFFTGLTANVSANAVNASTDLGHENFPMLMAGIASKTGYNFEFKGGKFIIQPSFLISYSFVHTFSHNNGRGNHVGSSPLNAIQIAPGIKFIANLPKGWQPYFGINMRWNIMDKTHFSLQDVSIPDMSVNPYVEYGIGVQRKWGERFTGYGQAMIRNGGRNGVMLSFGFKWALGK